MPTTSFIDETRIDRFYERGDDKPAVRPPAQYECEICQELFPSSLELARHRPQAHPLAPPAFWVGDRHVTGYHIIRRRLSQDEFKIYSATEIEITQGGRREAIAEQELFRWLSSQEECNITVTMRNRVDAVRPATEEVVDLHFEVADSEILDQVDAAFSARLGRGEVGPKSLESFDQSLSQIGASSTYGAALYDYCLAVAIKDGIVNSVGSERLTASREKSQAAFEVLREFRDRPIARAIAGFIRFGLNDLKRWTLAGVPDLDDCAGAMSFALDRTWKPPLSSKKAPLDRRVPTDDVLIDLITIWNADRSPARFLERSERAHWTQEDSTKAKVLAMLAFSDGDPIPVALVSSARTLVYDPIFGAWVDAWLQTHGGNR